MTILSKLNDARPDDWNKVKGTHADGRVQMEGLCPPNHPAYVASQCEEMRTVSVEEIIPDVLDTQIGGSHYQNYPIQPLEYTLANNLNFCQGNVVKYITRYKDKNGIEDLRKARHYVEILIEGYEKATFQKIAK